MSYQDLVDSVAETTKRPERQAQIQRALAKATLKIHLVDFWMRDIVEVKGDWTQNLQPRYELDTEVKLPGFRKIAYLNGYDDVTDPAHPSVMQQFTEKSPGRIRDDYGRLHWDVFYLAGKLITCWAGTFQPPRFLAGYYARPVVTPDGYNSWIAEMYAPAITDEACAEVFGSVGDADEAKRRRDMFLGNLQIVRVNDITATGE